MKFTLSVRSFHVPETPLTSAWPPSLPSVPTSRATRVTSAANERELVDHRVDRVLELEDLALDVDRDLLRQVAVGDRGRDLGDVAHLGGEVRRPCKLTLSVRSFHVPETPFTSAWPPSLPSVPTSRATRVTSSAKDESWSTIVLIVFFSSSDLALASTVIFCERSPLATAVVTSAMLRTWLGEVGRPCRFTLSVRSFQMPDTPSTSAWPPSLPSVPTSLATRVTSSAKDESWSTIVLIVFLSSRISPLASTVIFCDRSPLATAVVTSAMLRTWAVRFEAMQFTLSVRSLQVPATPFTSRLAAELPFGADLARDAGHLGGEEPRAGRPSC